MQSVKAVLMLLICLGPLSACGLKGPLYLPQDENATIPANQAQTEQAEDKEDDKKNKKDNQALAVSGR